MKRMQTRERSESEMQGASKSGKEIRERFTHQHLSMKALKASASELGPRRVFTRKRADEDLSRLHDKEKGYWRLYNGLVLVVQKLLGVGEARALCKAKRECANAAVGERSGKLHNKMRYTGRRRGTQEDEIHKKTIGTSKDLECVVDVRYSREMIGSSGLQGCTTLPTSESAAQLARWYRVVLGGHSKNVRAAT